MNISTMHFHNYEIQPGPLNITFGSDMPITFFRIYYIDIRIGWSNVIGNIRSECDVQRSRISRNIR